MRKRILIVDDLPENRYMLRALLEGHGYEVEEANNGAQALTCARQGVPDVIVTDLLMPQMDGFTLCRELGRDETLNVVPVIVYTATYTAPEDRELVLDLGAAAFVIKPAEPEEITGTIQAVIDGAPTPYRNLSDLSEDGFYARYSKRLEAKLTRKTVQLSAASKLLEEYVARCEAIFDASSDAIVAIDAEGLIRTWNLSAEQLFGYSESEALGQPVGMLTPPEKVSEEERMLAELGKRCTKLKVETERVRKDGTRLDVAISLSFLGPEIGIVALVSDLTTVRRAAEEKRQLEHKLAIAQRMETVGRLAGGVAHDFNNLLTVVLSCADFIETDRAVDPAHREMAKQIREAGECASSLTRRLLAFGRQRPASPKPVELNGAVRNAEKILRRLIGEHIEIVVTLDSTLTRIQADPAQVEQVILNLGVNARDAMPFGGRMMIETGGVEVDGEGRGSPTELHPGRYAVMIVRDTGLGMDEQTRARAFDPFFTTKAPGKGTGLGLATVHDIVRQGSGHIQLESSPGEGATFRIYWPLADEAPSIESVGDVVDGRGERVLLVEDEHVVRQLARRVLSGAGYRVQEAVSGEEAIELAGRFDEPIDLLVTDLVLQGIDGRELAVRLRSRSPDLRVLFMSGYSDGARPQYVLGRPVSLLAKPFATRELTSAVREALDANVG